MIGTVSPAEWKEVPDPDTGRDVTQLTSGRGHSYPLYYFVPSITRNQRFLVFHSERSGWVQLYRVDLRTGEIAQLTDGRTADSGWAPWCEWRLRGIYNHLSALNLETNDVYYFQGAELRATHVETLQNRLVTELSPERMPVGQTAFSPDGCHFAYIHVDRAAFMSRMAEREALSNMGLFGGGRGHLEFRRGVGAILSVVDVRTGGQRDVIEPGFYFHHALFLDNDTVLLNHPRDCAGMWTVDLAGLNTRHLRPAEAAGAHNAEVVHQVVTDRGVVYEAVRPGSGGGTTTYLGHLDPQTDRFDEVELPTTGYVHTGFDPAGCFSFIEHADEQHALFTVGRSDSSGVVELCRLRTLRTPNHHQRNHAHPFLTADRRKLIFTDRADNGFNQVFAMDVADLVSASDELPPLC